MSQILLAVGILLHTFGLIVFAGGGIWVTIVMGKAQKSEKPHGRAFVQELLKPVSMAMWIGTILLIVGGLIRLFGMNAVGLWGDTSNLWGTIMLVKHILVVVIVVIALFISMKFGPAMAKNAPKPGEPPSKTFLDIGKKLGKLSATNVFLTMIIVVISVLALVL
jgi:uncharacterized membrane protein